jgi:hypothetical protein
VTSGLARGNRDRDCQQHKARKIAGDGHRAHLACTTFMIHEQPDSVASPHSQRAFYHG